MTEVAIKEPEQAQIINGIDVGVLSETINAMRGDSELGAARFRVTKW
jgi:hypothetical protein